MSLGIVIKGPEGLVLAAESRLTLMAENNETHEKLPVSYDNATKLLSFSGAHENYGVVTYGQAVIGLRTAASFAPEFESKLGEERLPVAEFAANLSSFFFGQWQAVMPADPKIPNMTFLVAGFDPPEPYGRVFQIEIPRSPTPVELNPGEGAFGISWGGQRETVDRLIRGYDAALPDSVTTALGLDSEAQEKLETALKRFQLPVPLAAMPLQDCVDLAILFIRTTIATQALTVGLRGVGGPIDVATITRGGGLTFVQRKRITGEHDRSNPETVSRHANDA